MKRLEIEQRPSPNHGARAAGKPIDMIVLHYTGMPDAEQSLAWLCDPRSEVSAHYFVFEDGRLVQMVDEARRAWHAGVSFWAGETDINSRSIGIEIANPGHEFGYRSFPRPQIDAVIALCKDIITRHRVPPWRVLAHSDVAPLRKDDPGERFPWVYLKQAGIGLSFFEAPEEGPVLKPGDRGKAVRDLKRRLARFGYAIDDGDEYDATTAAVVTAFQRHFVQSIVSGIADRRTQKTLDRVLAAMPRGG